MWITKEFSPYFINCGKTQKAYKCELKKILIRLAQKEVVSNRAFFDKIKNRNVHKETKNYYKRKYIIE